MSSESPPISATDTAVSMVLKTLKRMKNDGWRGFDCQPETLTRLQNGPLGHPPADAGSETLDDIETDLGDCRRCGLSAGRRHIVFGEGHEQAPLVFVGEGPGQDEDRLGRPFVGAAGQLLTKIIQAMGLERSQVYIANVVKCRPPKNRNPQPKEIDICRPFLMRQLTAIQPQFICVLGKVAAHALLETERPISRLRGQFQTLGEWQVMPTYHPAYLLRSPEKKRDVWADIQKLMASLGLKGRNKS